MKSIALVSALAFGAMTAVATADPAVPIPTLAKSAVVSAAPTAQKGPIELSDAQADKITAGAHNYPPGYGIQTAVGNPNSSESGLTQAHDSAPGSAGYGKYNASQRHCCRQNIAPVLTPALSC